MTCYFAKIDKNNIVLDVVVVADEDAKDWENGWIQTWIDGGKRKNYAGVGMIYDPNKDAFIGFSPFPSWILNQETCKWNPPIPMPEPVEGMIWVWNESEVNWKSIKGMEL